MPHTTTVQEIKNFFGHIEKIQIMQDEVARNKAIDSVFAQSLNNNPAKLASLYSLFSQKSEDSQYQQLLIYSTFRVLLEQNGLATEQATKLYTLFNKDINKIKKYLSDYAKQNLNSPEPMHDACNFAIPSSDSTYTSKVWADLSAKYLAELPFRQLLAQAPEIEALIKLQARGIQNANTQTKKAISDLTEEIAILNSSIKKRRSHASKLTEEQKVLLQQDADTLIQKKSELTAIGVPFNNELSLTALTAFKEQYILETSKTYKRFLKNGLTKKDYDKFMKLERHDDDSIIPPLMIDGATIGHPGYYLMKVPVMNEAHAARAAYFGKLTHCCQSLSGEAGEPCVIHGLTSPNGGFYVICYGDVQNPKVTNKVLGQSWVWRGKKNGLVFDSIEITNKTKRIYKNTQQIVTDLVHQGAKVLVEHYNVDTVLCGKNSGISKEIGIAEVLSSEQFKDYHGYSDSKDQLILKDKYRPYYFFGKDTKSTQTTIQWIETILKNKTPLTNSILLWEALNWALLFNHAHLINKIQTLAHQTNPSRLLEINNLINTLDEYIEDGLTPNILSHIDRNLFFIEARESLGYSPLILAAQQGDTDFVKKLIQAKANLNCTTIAQITAIMGASMNGHVSCVNELIQAKAELEHKNQYGQTALILAIISEHKQTIKALIEAGANLKDKDNQGKTVLMYALECEDDEIFKMIEKALQFNPKLERLPETKATLEEPEEPSLLTIHPSRPSQ